MPSIESNLCPHLRVLQGKLQVVNFKRNDEQRKFRPASVHSARDRITKLRLYTGKVTATDASKSSHSHPKSSSANVPDQHAGLGSSHIVAPKNVQEARAWIVAWKQQTGFPKLEEVHRALTHGPNVDAEAVTHGGPNANADAPANVRDARLWIASWKAQQADASVRKGHPLTNRGSKDSSAQGEQSAPKAAIVHEEGTQTSTQPTAVAQPTSKPGVSADSKAAGNKPSQPSSPHAPARVLPDGSLLFTADQLRAQNAK